MAFKKYIRAEIIDPLLDSAETVVTYPLRCGIDLVKKTIGNIVDITSQLIRNIL